MVTHTDFNRIDCFRSIADDNNIYVMKVIPYEDHNSMETAHQEQQLMSQANHRNICKYVDSFITDGNKLNLIMEYCDRGDFEQYLKRMKEMNSQNLNPA